MFLGYTSVFPRHIVLPPLSKFHLNFPLWKLGKCLCPETLARYIVLENISWNKNKNKNHTMFRLPFINCFLSKKHISKKNYNMYVLRTVQNYKSTKIICINQSM